MWLAVLAAAAVVVAVRQGAHATPDASWLLYSAGRILDGARLGADLVDATPPTILGFKLVAVTAGRILGVAPWAAWVAWLGVLALGSAAAALRIVRGADGWRSRGAQRRALAAVAAVLLLLPRHDYGQREHLALILTLPYVALLGVRAGGQGATRALAIGAGIAAGIGMSLKPHFALLLILAVGFLALRARIGFRRAALLPEHGAAALTGLAAVAAVLLFAHGWVRFAGEYGGLYLRYIAENPLLVALSGVGAAVGVFALLALLALGPHAGARRPAAEALLLAAGSFHLAAALQGKGFQYHFLPTIGFGALSIALLWSGLRRPLPRLAPPLYGAAAFAILATLATYSVRDIAIHAAGGSPRRPDLDPAVDALSRIVRAEGPSPTIMVFSTSIASGFPLTTETGARWSSRHSGLWMLSALYSDQLFQGRMVVPRAPGQRPPLERRLLDEMYQDLRARPPALLFVITPDPSFNGWAGARQFDYLEYFASETGLAELLSRYSASGEVGPYLVLRPAAAAASGPPSLPDVPATAQGRNPERAVLRAPPGVVLLLALCFGVGVLLELRARRSSG